MANEIVERVARALCAAQGVAPTENEMARATEEARAAIEAMREPTKDMLYSGADEIGYSKFKAVPEHDALEAAWTRMIGAALAPQD